MTRLAGVLALAVIAAAACAPAAARSDHTIFVTIRHSRFEPAAITVPAGTSARIVVENTDPIDHEFILGDELVQGRHATGRDGHHGEVPGEVSIDALSEASTIYTFNTPGALTFACHLPGHYAYGMVGSVTVE